MRRELPAPLRVALLAGCAVVLFVSLAGVGTRAGPYAPNDWLFSHTHLAQRALDEGAIPLNRDLLVDNTFEETHGRFQEETGLSRMTFYATTMWHFWNGLPLHPSLVATLALLTGGTPEDTVRLPLGGAALVLLAYASADLLLSRTGGAGARAAALAPLLLAAGSAPFALDLRVLMPSTSLVVLALLLHLLLRRLLARDERALAMAIVPLALLPFWYYTVSYFVIILFAGVLAANVAMRWLRPDAPPLVPSVVAALVPLALVGALFLNGALTSHVEMASQMSTSPFLTADAGGDYETHLNRDPWRSALLYAGTLLLFAPFAAVSLVAAARILRRKAVSGPPVVFAQWALAGAAYSVLLNGAVGISFLNRSVIYLSPVAALAAAWAFARWWDRPRVRACAAALVVVLGALTAAFVAGAAPTYDEGDRAAFLWAADAVPREAVVYASLDVASVLFREHGFHDAIAFHPRVALLEDFWYSENAETVVPYLTSFDYFVLRDEAMTAGFEEFGPLREPVSEAAYAKFAASRDLHLVFDNGDVQVFRVGLAPERLHRFGDGPAG